MKKNLLALTVLGAFAGAAQAQSNVTVYGAMDIGLIKATGETLAIGRGDNNKLGFKGAEDLGNGLSANFRLEMRFEPDTGTTESGGRRPLFQGRSVVGLSGPFGTIKLGRDLTAVQDPIGDFDPFGFQTVGSLDAILGNYSTDPSYAGSSGNRLSNGVYYSTPSMGGFQVNATLASKEGLNGGPQLNSNPYSLSATYANGPLAALVGVERSTAEDKFWTVSGAYRVGVANLIASYSRLDRAVGVRDTNWLVAADIAVGVGSVKVGYGQVKPENAGANKQVSLGYWHNLSKRTMLYTDATSRKPAVGASSNAFDVGIHHTF